MKSKLVRIILPASLLALFICGVIMEGCSPPGPTVPVSDTGQTAATVVPNGSSSGAGSAAQPAAAQQPTEAPTDIPTATAIPSPTRVPAQLIQLMEGECCASPSWYSDSEQVLFIDKPTADAATGIYSVNIGEPKKSTLWNEQIAFYTRNYDYAQIPEKAGTRLIRVSDGKEIRVLNGGRQVQFSPDRTRVVWTETRETFPIEDRVSNIMIATISFDDANVGEAERITQVLRGGVSGWLDDNRLLLNGRLSKDTEDSVTFVHDLTTGKDTNLVTAERTRLGAVSRDGTWFAYAIVNDKEPARNGLWVIRTDGTDAKKLEMFGAAQWRDDGHLVIAPFEMNVDTHSFYDYNAETGETNRLTPPTMPFKVASGDWTISPDGNKIVFANAADNNLWLWRFDE